MAMGAGTPRAGTIGAVMAREWQHLHADPWDLGMLTWIPLLLCLLMWWILSAGVPRELPLAVVDADQSALSRNLVRWLDASPGLHVVLVTRDAAQALTEMRRRQVYGILSLPSRMQADIGTGRGATVQWAYNAQFAAHAGGMSRDVRAVATTLSVGIERVAREKRGASPIQANELYEPVKMRLATLFNESGSYEPFLGLAAVMSLLQIFIVIAAITSIGRELRGGTVTQWLAAGGNWGRAIAGKLALPLLAFCLHCLLVIVLFAALRGWRIEGSVAMTLAGMLLLILAYLALGTLLIAVTLSLRSALSAAAFIAAPAFAFSGQGFPLLAMPPLARAWAEALPLTHYLQLQSRTWLEGAPWQYTAADAALLLAFAVAFGAPGCLLLSRRGADPRHWGRR